MVRDNPETFADLDGHDLGDDGAGGPSGGASTSSTSSSSSSGTQQQPAANPQGVTSGAPQNQTPQPQQQGQPNPSNTPAPTNPDGTPKAPPVPPPPGKDGKPNEWERVPGTTDRPDKWKPKTPVQSPKGGQPSASWDDKRGHWDVTDGLGKTTRYLPDGTKVDHFNNPIPAQAAKIAAIGIMITAGVKIAIATFPEWGPALALAF